MYSEMMKLDGRKKTRTLVAFVMAVVLVYSLAIPAFAFDFINNGFYFNGVQVNGGTIYEGTQDWNGGDFADTITGVPVSNVTFKLLSPYTLYPDAPCYDPNTQDFSTTLHNHDKIEIRKASDNSLVSVTAANTNSCSSTPYTGTDAYINVVPQSTLEYNTAYKLIIKQYYTKVNRYCSFTGGVTEDTVINFVTVAQ